jgi:hypothetical protein
MSIDAVAPLRRRVIEDMNASKLCAQTQGGATFTAVSSSLSFSNHHPRRRLWRTSAGSSCIFPRRA